MDIKANGHTAVDVGAVFVYSIISIILCQSNHFFLRNDNYLWNIIFYFFFLRLRVYCPRGRSPIIDITILYLHGLPDASWTTRPRRPPPKTFVKYILICHTALHQVIWSSPSSLKLWQQFTRVSVDLVRLYVCVWCLRRYVSIVIFPVSCWRKKVKEPNLSAEAVWGVSNMLFNLDSIFLDFLE